ncbi:MAG: hypothetical protein WB689_22330 [Xanthobacteraceae bacterium]
MTAHGFTQAAMIMTFVGNTATGLDFKSFRVRGINVAAIDIPLATDLIQQLATSAQGAYVTVTGAHGIVESVHSERIRKAHEQAAMIVPDGMPLVWLGRLLASPRGGAKTCCKPWRRRNDC